ncbi:MAG TPA: hypothetical protein VLE49_09445 [Anaerolineales bacterium]|nr:hypothetical protein [Anaerolineales bacterium]
MGRAPYLSARSVVTGLLDASRFVCTAFRSAREALQSSEGLSLPHLRQALEHIKHRATGQKVLAIHRAKFESLREQLAEFIRKNDYQVIAEGFGQEGDAWLRAIATIAGSRKKM